MSTADVYLGFCAVIAQVFHILWILAAWKAYYNRYFDYKIILQSIAFVNFLYALIFNWFLDIEVMFPLPALTVSGFFKFLPYTMPSRMFTVAVTVSLAAVSCLAVAEAIYIRVLFLYQKHNWIKAYTRFRRAAVYVLVSMAAILAGAAVSYFDIGDVEVLKKQFPSQNRTYEEDDVIHVIISPKQFQDLVTYVAVFCGGFSAVGTLICLAVYPISLRRHNNLNYDKVNNEKSFTIMLIMQCLIPLTCIGAPFFTAMLSWSPSYAEDNANLRYIPTAVWIFFPLFNSASSIFLLEPYRRYVARLFGCTQRNRSVVPSIVVHGVESARPEIPQNNPVSSVEQPAPPEEPPQVEIEEEKEIEPTPLEPRRTYPIRLPPLEADTPRRFSLETDTVAVPTRERRPSVFSRLSYFL